MTRRRPRIEIVETQTLSSLMRARSHRPHYLRLIASNGAILAHSESYANLTNARRAVDVWVAAFEQIARDIDTHADMIREVAQP